LLKKTNVKNANQITVEYRHLLTAVFVHSTRKSPRRAVTVLLSALQRKIFCIKSYELDKDKLDFCLTVHHQLGKVK